MKDLTTYLEHPGISQSYLKSLAYLKTDEEEELPKFKLGMTRGSVVDWLLTDSTSRNEFVIQDVKRPPDFFYKVAHILYSRGLKYDESVNICKELNYYNGRRKDGTIINDIRESGLEEYLDFLYFNDGKCLVTSEEWSEWSNIADYIFNKHNMHTWNGEFQKDLYGNILDVPAKGLLDYTEDNLVVDFKITDSWLDYYRDMIKMFRTDIQLTWYSILRSGNSNNIPVNSKLIVYSTKDRNTREFTMTDADYKLAFEGDIKQMDYFKSLNIYKEKQVIGIRQLLNIYKNGKDVKEEEDINLWSVI